MVYVKVPGDHTLSSRGIEAPITAQQLWVPAWALKVQWIPVDAELTSQELGKIENFTRISSGDNGYADEI